MNSLFNIGGQLKTFNDIKDLTCSTFMFHETYAQSDGIIERNTTFPKSSNELIYAGPHFYVGNSYYKTPRRICTEKAHYDVIDLKELPKNYLSRTNYLPAVDDFIKYIPTLTWDKSKLMLAAQKAMEVGIMGIYPNQPITNFMKNLERNFFNAFRKR